MRILHVCSWFQPQLGYSEYHLPIAQQRLGHQVAVVTSDRYYPFPDYQATVQPLLGKRVVGSGTREEHGLLTYRLPVAFEYRHHLWLCGVDQVIARFRPEIVQVYQSFTLPTLQCALAKPKHGFGLVLRSSMEKEVFFPQTRSRRLYYWFYAAIAGPVLRRRVDSFTAVGPGARDIVRQVFALPAEQVEVVPLGADSERFRFDPEARREIRQEIGIAGDMVLAIYAGKLIPDKDVHVLVTALGEVQTRRSLGLLLLGDGAPDYKVKLRKIAQAAHKPVFFHSPVSNSDLSRFFSAADFGVWPSESSNAAVEAALVGLPLVVSSSDATKHYIEAGNGLSFSRGDVLGLALCLERLTDAPELRQIMGERGRDHMMQRLSWKVIAQHSLDSYRKILDAGPE